MSALKQGVRLLAVMSVVGLAACGGGGDSPANTNNNGGAAPSDTGAATVYPAADTLVVTNSAGTTVVAQSYALDTAYNQASGTLNLGANLDLEMVSPENPSFDSGFAFVQQDPTKYYFAYVDNGVSGNDEAYVCASTGWTNAQLASLIKVAELDSSTTPATCSGTVLIDAATHTIKFVGVKLVSRSDASKSITVSANFSWTLQSGSDVFGTGSSGSGSGAVSGGAISSTATPAVIGTLP